MSRTIWKYAAAIDDEVVLKMPVGAKPLHVEREYPRTFVLWAEVNPEAHQIEHRFGVYGTGNPVPDHPGEYVGTIIDSPFVWHIYYRGTVG